MLTIKSAYTIISVLVTFLTIQYLAAAHDDFEKSTVRIDVFHKILAKENVVGAQVLSVEKLQKVIMELSERFRCNDMSGASKDAAISNQANDFCSQALCLNASQVIKFVEGNASQGVSEDKFDSVSLVLLYYMTQIKSVCNKQQDLSSLTLDRVTTVLLSLAKVDHHHMHETQISNLLNTFKERLSHDEHEDHTESVQSHDEHDHQHEAHDHQHEAHDHQHEAHDHQHEDHSHDHHDEDHENENHVVKAKCLSSDAVFYYMGADHAVDNDQIGSLASLIVYFIYDGYEIEDKCRLLPQKGEFIDYLFLTFAASKSNMSVTDLQTVMMKLGINPGSQPDEHGHNEAEVHNHKKRSVSKHDDINTRTNTLNRVKRQTTNLAAIKQCYSANQIMALYDAQNGVVQETFQQICPSLLSQKLFADCSVTSKQVSASQATMAEKYGYSTIATAIICLCSIFGVIFIPFVSKSVYDILMSSFVGLAVGTLFSDAVLHLIPMALGIHNHGDEHDHGHAHGPGIIVVEEYVLYGLAIMAGLYFFYILETMMSRFGGHSHSHDHDDSDMMEFSNDHPPKSETYEVRDEQPKERCGNTYDVSGSSQQNLKEQNSSRFACGLTPVALMIILGDAIHNFADGLAIGASFTSGISTGIATSIAVFCHELPHELGDFAVLLQSGLSFKKAVFLNLGSALTAFAGLYVSLSVTTGEEAQKWIFAVASGMFLYIALVDLLPQLIKTSGLLHFVLNNIGILVGFAIMLVIAIFEEHIVV